MDGTNGDDHLVGNPGVDELVGLLGNDRYDIHDASVDVIEAVGGGYDKVRTTVSYVLAAGEEIEVLRALPGVSGLSLTGNEFDNLLMGGVGAEGINTLTGGAGDDRYYVGNSGAQVFEAAGGGTDTIYTTVSFTLVTDQEIEYLRVHASASALMLTGNNLDNVLVGSNGNDMLDGGTGNDRIHGRAGDDTITTAGDSAMIDAGDGDDTIRLDGASTATGTVKGGSGDDTVRSSDLGQFVIRGVETFDTYYGFANASVRQLASFDHITADLVAADAQISLSLRGAGGMLDFTTVVGGDNSIEIRDAGLTSAINITGSVNDDRLIGTRFNDTLKGGNGSDVLFGNEGSDTLNGGSGVDRLNGGTENDTLLGGAGNDTFVFDMPIGGGTNIDRIVDFAPGADRIEINQEYYFTGLVVGELAPEQFAVGAATGTGPQIVYVKATGALYYDANGADAGGESQFAVLAGRPVVTASDFLIV